MADPDVVQLAPRLHRLRIPGGAAHLLNCYLWVGETGVTLVDTGWPGSAAVIVDAVLTVGKQRTDVERIVLTHLHEDHAGSAAEISGWSSVVVIAGSIEWCVTAMSLTSQVAQALWGSAATALC